MKLIRCTSTQEASYENLLESLLQSSEDLVSLHEAMADLNEMTHALEMYALITDTIQASGGVTKSLEVMFGENFSSVASMEEEAQEEKKSWIRRIIDAIKGLWNKVWKWIKGLFGIHDAEEAKDANTLKLLEAAPEEAEFEVVIEPEHVEKACLLLETASEKVEETVEKISQVQKQAEAYNEKIASTVAAVAEETKQCMDQLEAELKPLEGRTDNTANVERRNIGRKISKKETTRMIRTVNKAKMKRNRALKRVAQKASENVIMKEIEKAAEDGKITADVAKVMKEDVEYVIRNTVKLEQEGKLLNPDSLIRHTAGQGALKDDIKEGSASAETVEGLRENVMRGLKQKGYAFVQKNKEIVADAEKIASEKGWQLYETGKEPACKAATFLKLKKRDQYEKLLKALPHYFCKEDVSKAMDLAGDFEDKH